MLPRFFAPGLPAAGETIRLPDEEAHHLRAVMRLRAGAIVHVFDGRGREARAVVEAIDRKAVSLRIGEETTPARERAAAIRLVQSVLRPDRMDDVVRDAVMMGVATLVPLVTANVAVSAGSLKGDRSLERWRRVALASAKQCGRAVVPDLVHPRAFRDWLEMPTTAARIALVEPGATRSAACDPASLRALARRHGADVAIGPEGGWAPDEIDALAAGGVGLWSLGGRTLRADAVPVAALAVLEYFWER